MDTVRERLDELHFDDHDHDGTARDERAGSVLRAGTYLGAGVSGAITGAVQGVDDGPVGILTGARDGFAEWAEGAREHGAVDAAGRVGERWGDAMTDLLGDRNPRSPNAAAEGGHSGGATIRRALAPGTFGDLGARVGGVAGGVLGGAVGFGLGNVVGAGTGTLGAGAPLVSTPTGAMLGTTVGAVGGMAVGSEVDRALERLDGVRRRLVGSEH